MGVGGGEGDKPGTSDVPYLRFFAFLRGGEADSAKGLVGGGGTVCLMGVLEASCRTPDKEEDGPVEEADGAGAVASAGRKASGWMTRLMPMWRR